MSSVEYFLNIESGQFEEGFSIVVEMYRPQLQTKIYFSDFIRKCFEFNYHYYLLLFHCPKNSSFNFD